MADIYENYLVDCSTGVTCTARSAISTRRISQTFLTGTTQHTVTSIVLKIYKQSGVLIGSSYLSLYTTRDGLPDTLIAGTTVTISENDIPTSDNENTEIIIPETTLETNTLYAIVLESDLGPVFLRGQIGNPYANGDYSYDSGTGWTIPTDGTDLMFQILGNPIGVTYDCTNPNGYINDIICGNTNYGQSKDNRYQCTSTGWLDLGVCTYGCTSGACNSAPPEPPPQGIDMKILFATVGIIVVTATAFYLAGRRKRRK